MAGIRYRTGQAVGGSLAIPANIWLAPTYGSLAAGGEITQSGYALWAKHKQLPVTTGFLVQGRPG
ncbi:MAG: hypothetical protein ACYDDN_10555 [Candidatus Desulforudaceae bacterium]|nr:hypothetical protein [Desulforudis sp.]